MRHAYIAAQLLVQAGIIDRRLRHMRMWGASALIALGAFATVVSGLA
jgi:hypothetical protein